MENAISAPVFDEMGEAISVLSETEKDETTRAVRIALNMVDRNELKEMFDDPETKKKIADDVSQNIRESGLLELLYDETPDDQIDVSTITGQILNATFETAYKTTSYLIGSNQIKPYISRLRGYLDKILVYAREEFKDIDDLHSGAVLKHFQKGFDSIIALIPENQPYMVLQDKIVDELALSAKKSGLGSAITQQNIDAAIRKTIPTKADYTNFYQDSYREIKLIGHTMINKLGEIIANVLRDVTDDESESEISPIQSMMNSMYTATENAFEKVIFSKKENDAKRIYG